MTIMGVVTKDPSDNLFYIFDTYQNRTVRNRCECVALVFMTRVFIIVTLIFISYTLSR